MIPMPMRTKVCWSLAPYKYSKELMYEDAEGDEEAEAEETEANGGGHVGGPNLKVQIYFRKLRC